MDANGVPAASGIVIPAMPGILPSVGMPVLSGLAWLLAIASGSVLAQPAKLPLAA